MSAGYLAKCGRKKRHRTQAGAERQRGAMIARKRWTWAGSNTYWCNICGSYHAGHLNGSPRGKSRKTAKNTPRFLATQ